MDRKQQRRLDALAQVLGAMAHPSRLLVLEELTKGERCVCELQALIGSDQSTVSKHLALLKNAGLVATQKRGSRIYYSLQVCCVPRFLQCVEAVLEEKRSCQLEMNR